MSVSKDQLFQIKQKFLQQIPHPKLIKTQIKRLKRDEVQPTFHDYKIENELNLSSYLNQYTDSILKLKLNIANASDAKELHHFISILLELHQALIDKLCTYLPDQEYEGDQIKQSDPFDSYELYKEIEEKGIAENEIKNYLCTQFSNRTAVEYTELAQAVIRAKKILDNA